MKVLMITGDKRMLVPGTEAHARFSLQQAWVEKLEVLFWGKGSLFSFFGVRGRFDVVTTQDPFWRGLIGWFLARRTGAKLNVQVHADMAGQSFIRHILAQIVLNHADSVRVVSEKIKKQIERMDIHAPVRVLPVFVDAMRFRHIQRTAHPRFKKVILWVGRLEPEKDPAQALLVLKQARDHGADAGLVYLGSGSLEPMLRAQAEPQKDHVEFAGWRDPAPYLGMADVVLCTSPRESYGVSIIEALAAGVPVVAPDVGIAREAGATIASPHTFAAAVVEGLRSGVRGELKLELLSKEDWAKRWTDTLA